MTFREKLMKEHPERVGPEYDGGCEGCPHNYAYTNEGTCPNGMNCAECWDRECEVDVAEKIKDTFVKLHEIFDHGVSIAIVYRLIDRGYFDK